MQTFEKIPRLIIYNENKSGERKAIMKKTMRIPELIQIKKRNIKTEAGAVTLKYINPTNENRLELIERLENAPHLNELLNLLDADIHKRVIIECDDLNIGISAAGQIGGCMNDFADKTVIMETDVDFDDYDIFFDDEAADEDENVIMNVDENN